LEKDADVNAKDNYGDTPLLKACFFGHEDIVSLLLVKRANVNTKSNRGETPLSWAVFNEQKETVSLLLKKDADSQCQRQLWRHATSQGLLL
jgi:ankyrin repeat protein